MFNKYALKAVGAVATILQYGCVTHCALEYIGDFVVVRLFMYIFFFTLTNRNKQLRRFTYFEVIRDARLF